MSAGSISRRVLAIATSVGMLTTYACSSADAPAGPGAGNNATPTPPVAASVEIQAGSDTMIIGTTRGFVARVLDRTGTPVDLPVNWRSLTPSVVDVNSTGLVTAIATGNAALVASSGSAADTAAFVVRQLDEALQISPDLIQIIEGDELQLETRVAKSLGGTLSAALEWQSSDEQVADVDSTGRLVALAEGDATLTVRMGNYTAFAAATVVKSTVSSIVLSPTSVTLNVGEKETFRATVRDANGRTLSRTVAWTSSDTSIATITSSGQVTTRRPGFSVISASTSGKTSSATLTVRSLPATSVSVKLASTSQAVGLTQVARVVALDQYGKPVVSRAVPWNSSIPSVATVDSAGRIVARAAGKTRISAIVDAVVGYADLTVFSPVATSIKVSPATVTVALGATGQMTAVVLDQNGTPLSSQPTTTWSSAQPSIAAVASNGMVTGVANGTTTIKAVAGTMSSTASVSVTAIAVASLQVSPSAPALVVGDSVNLSVQALDAFGNVLTGRAISYSSSAPGIATVSASGTIIAVAPGTSTITATSSGVAKSVVATVTAPAVAAVSVTLAQPTLSSGQSTTATATIISVKGTPLTPCSVAWSSNDPTIATVASRLSTRAVTSTRPSFKRRTWRS